MIKGVPRIPQLRPIGHALNSSDVFSFIETGVRILSIVPADRRGDSFRLPSTAVIMDHGPPSLPGPEELGFTISAAENAQMSRYLGIASASILFYDYLLCLPNGACLFVQPLAMLTYSPEVGALKELGPGLANLI